MRRRIWLLTGLFVATALRFYRLDGQSLWADEGNSAALASRSLAQIARDAAHDIHPPLYYWLLHFWTGLFGTSEVALRSLSAVLGVLLVILIYRVGQRLWDGTAAVAAAFVAATNPFQIYYAQEARMYMLLALLGVGAAWAMQEMAAGRKTGFALYILCAALGLYTHYSFPFLLIALNLGYLLWLAASWRKGHGRRSLLAWGGAQIATVILYLPWLPMAWQRVTAWPSAGSTLSLSESLQLAAGWLYLGPAAKAVEPDWLRLMPFALACLALIWRRSRTAGRDRWPRQAFLFLWLLLPPALLLASGAFREANLKFLLMSSPALCLLLGWEVADALDPLFRPPLARLKGGRFHVGRLVWLVLVLAFLAVPTAQALSGYYANPRLARDDYRGIARYIAAVAREGDAIILNAPGQAEVFAYYDRSGLPVYPLPRQRPADRAITEAELARLAGQHQRLYVLFWATDESDPGRIVETWLDTHAFKALDGWQGNVRFVTYGLGAGTRRVRWESSQVPPQWGDPPVIMLVQADMDDTASAGDIVRVSLLWRALRPIAERYKITVQLLDARDQVIAQHDAEPAGNSRPTTGWNVDEEVVDPHGIYIPPGTPPGAYRLIVALYRLDTGARLDLAGEGDRHFLGNVAITRPPAPPPLAALRMPPSRRIGFGPIHLLGFDRYRRGFGHAPETPLRAGDLLHLTFYWQAQITPAQDWVFRLELLDGRGRTVSELFSPPAGDAYPTSRWQAGEIVRGEHDLLLPAGLTPGRYRLRLTLLPGDASPTSSVILGTIAVQP
jgi:mannosyltransferase